MSKPFPDLDVTVSALKPAAISSRLGFLCLAVCKDKEDARKLFEKTLAENPDDAAALDGIADVDTQAGRFAEAGPLYQRAMLLGKDDVREEVDYGRFYMAQALKESDPDAKAKLLEQAQQHFQQSVKLDDKTPAGHAEYGWSFQIGGDSAKAMDELVQAHNLLPGNPGIKLMLANVYASMGFKDRAVHLARQVAVWSRIPTEKKEANQLLAHLTDGAESADESDTTPDQGAAPR